jgi:hypothetical protein
MQWSDFTQNSFAKNIGKKQIFLLGGFGGSANIFGHKAVNEISKVKKILKRTKINKKFSGVYSVLTKPWHKL